MTTHRTYLDLTMPISPTMPTYRPDHFAPTLTPYADIESDGWAGREIRIDSHCGTHVDAASHFVRDGDPVDQISLDLLIGRAQVVAVTAVPDSAITAVDLPAITEARVVLHTGWGERVEGGGVEAGGADVDRAASEHAYFAHHSYLDRSAAEHLVAAGVRLVGIDAPSIDPPDVDIAHHILLGAGVVVVENMANTASLPERFDLVIAPLRLVDCDGSPARAIAIVTEELDEPRPPRDASVGAQGRL